MILAALVVTVSAVGQENKTKGFWMDVALSTGDGFYFQKNGSKMFKIEDNQNHTTYGADIAFGYRLAPQFAIGGGIGANFQIKQHGATLPVFARLRWDWLNKFCTPYLNADLGFAIPTSGGNFTCLPRGPFADVDLGVSFRIENGNRMYIGCRSGIMAYNENWFVKAADKVDNPSWWFKVPIMARVGFEF